MTTETIRTSHTETKTTPGKAHLAAPALLDERDALRDAAKEFVTRWDEVRRGLRDPSCLAYANELALTALAKGAK